MRRTPAPCQWFDRLADTLDKRSAPRLAWLFPGPVLARGTFRDVKQVVGAGQQQVRYLWANTGAFHVCLWTFTLTEAWAWNRSVSELVDRSDSPRDTPSRRPSYTDKRRAWRRDLLGEEIRAVLRPEVTDEAIQAIAERLLGLAA